MPSTHDSPTPQSEVALREIDADSVRAVCKLSVDAAQQQFVERNAVQAFNFQATVTILLVAAHLIASTPLVLVGASLLHVILVLAAAPLTIWAAWRARGGYAFTYPVALPFLR